MGGRGQVLERWKLESAAVFDVDEAAGVSRAALNSVNDSYG